MKIITLEEYKNLGSKYEQLEYVYNYCIFSGWRTKELEKLASSLEVNVMTIRERGKRYASRYLNMSKEDLKKLTSDYTITHSLSTKYYDLLKKIINMDDRREITKLIEQGNYNLETFKHKINEYVYKDYANLSNEEQKELIIKLRKKIIPYGYEEELENRKLERQKHELDRKLEFVETTFKEIIELKLSKKEAIKKYFCNCYARARYDNDLEYVRVYFPELYKKYLDFRDSELNKEVERYNYVIDETRKVAFYIKNGIEFDKRVRDFDVVDFYEMFDITIDELFKTSGDDNVISYEQRSLIRQFIKKNTDGLKMLNEIRINEFIDKKVEIDCQKDEKGFPIVGTGVIISEEEKRNMIQYLIDKNIPLTNKTSGALLARHKEEIIYLRHNKVKEKVLERKPNN